MSGSGSGSGPFDIEGQDTAPKSSIARDRYRRDHPQDDLPDIESLREQYKCGGTGWILAANADVNGLQLQLEPCDEGCPFSGQDVVMVTFPHNKLTRVVRYPKSSRIMSISTS